MKTKQSKKNVHKEKIVMLEQNKIDCDYIEKIRGKAYELYEKRGCQPGQDKDDWLEAEKLIEK